MNINNPDNTPLDQYATHGGTAAQATYASFGSRVLAVIIDAIILGVSGKVIGLLLGGDNTLTEGFGYLLGLAYNIYLHYKWGATPGKLVLDIKVVSQHGGGVSLQQAVYRECFQYLYIITAVAVSIMTPGVVRYTSEGNFDFSLASLTLVGVVTSLAALASLVDVLWAIGHPQRQTLHDIVAETYCVKVKE